MTQPVALNIGYGVEVTPVLEGGVFIGILWSHPSFKNPTGRCAGGMVPFKGRAADKGYAWDLVSETPLTLVPALLCNDCNCHGFITDGSWRPV